MAIAGVVTVMALVTLLFSRPIRALERRLGTRQSVHIELVGADVSDATDLLILRGTLSDLVDAATVTTGAGPPPSLFVDGDLRAEQIADVLSSARDNGFSATVGPGHTGVS